VRALLLVSSVALLLSCSRAARPEAQSTRQSVIIFAANLRGYVNPCGCTENMRGGIARAAGQIEREKQSGNKVLFVEGGDSLFGSTKMLAEEIEQQEYKAKALAAAFKKMGVWAKGISELDLSRGAEFVSGLALPTASSGEVRLTDFAGVKVAAAFGDDAESLNRAVTSGRSQGAQWVIAFLHQSLEVAMRTVGATTVDADLIVATHSVGESEAEETKQVPTKPPLLALQSKGRTLGRVVLSAKGSPDQRFAYVEGSAEKQREIAAIDERALMMKKEISDPNATAELKAAKQNRLDQLLKRRLELEQAPQTAPEGNSFQVEFVPLESSMLGDPAVAEIIRDYDRNVGSLNLEWAKKHGKECPLPEKGQAMFVGTESCRACHAAAFKMYDASKHAHAYKTLVDTGKQNHLDCVACHVTGYQKPGGVCRLDKASERANVGCESCHGAGSLHVKAPSKKTILGKPERQHCVGCHNPENSPHFDFKLYLPKILGVGHSAKSP
jgi:hypothetical protein